MLVHHIVPPGVCLGVRIHYVLERRDVTEFKIKCPIDRQLLAQTNVYYAMTKAGGFAPALCLGLDRPSAVSLLVADAKPPTHAKGQQRTDCA